MGTYFLTQLANAEIVRSDIMTRVQTRDFTVVCEFNFSGLPFHLRLKWYINNKMKLRHISS